MTLTILFDLDDTLLRTNTGEFLPAYFKGLGQALAHLGAQEEITDQIRFAVGKMVANQDPSKLLREIFSENFYPPLGTTETECQEILENFYDSEYPKLRSLVQPISEAETLITWCKSQQMRLAITTNPLFPETATRQRVRWAGLDPEDFLYISTYDNFHFTKPNLSYYAEAIGRLGWPEETIVMVGDNLTHDILPAEAMGLETFWIDPEVETTERPHGALSDLQGFLASQKTENKISLENDPEVLIAILRSTPAVLDTWLEMNEREALKQRPSKNEWGPNEIFWHLADFEERVYHPQWKQLLQNPDQIAPHIETSHWAEERDYKSRNPVEAYQKFLRYRQESLEMIESLLEKGFFEVSVHHTVFSEALISELVEFAARHDRLHIKQCADTLKI